MAEPIAQVAVAEPIDARIDALYVVPDPESVQPFLAANGFLVDLLVQARPAIAQHFPGASVFLELLRDPENGVIHKLTAAIAPCVAPAEAVARFEDLIAAWWYPHFPEAQDRLALTLQYR